MNSNITNNHHEHDSLMTPRNSDLIHEKNIERNKKRLAASFLLGLVGFTSLGMAADTVIHPGQDFPTEAIEVIVESGIALAGISAAALLGSNAVRNLKAYNEI